MTAHPEDRSRRAFIGTTVSGLAAGARFIAESQQPGPGGIPTRLLGRTGERVSIIGLGGWAIGRAEKAEAVAIMHAAIDEGLRFFDNCWDYGEGWAEEIMGVALESGSRRDQVFLETKTCGRTGKYAQAQLEDSLRRLRTDRIDLWMFHNVGRDWDVERIFGKGGALEVALEARRAGKVRLIGFSGHGSPELHLKMLEQGVDFDAVLMPVNLSDAHFDGFQARVAPVLARRGIGALAMKATEVGSLPVRLSLDATLCRRYTLSQPIASLMCGIQNWNELREAVAVARDFRPLCPDEISTLLTASAGSASNGRHEAHECNGGGCDWEFNLENALAAT